MLPRKQRMRKLFLSLFSFTFSFLSHSQNSDGLIARYYFNDGKALNDLTGLPVKASGIAFGEDRFGNSSSSCYLNGNINSYLNLGTSDNLKPSTGSISLWLEIGTPIYAGRGYQVNPIMLTKCCEGNDFFEAYSICYSLGTKQMSVCCTLDSITQITVNCPEIFPVREWHHLVMTYDDNELSFYLDAKLEGRVNKNFHSKFLGGDSVMVGNSANSKNSRYLNGNVDDIRIYNKVLSQDEISKLYNEPDPNRLRTFLKWAFVVLVFILFIWITVALFIRRYKKELEKEKIKNLLKSQMFEMEMKVIKAQMNPHFIFNSMNSIQQLMLSDNVENANKYLVKFSRLLRKILESNTEEFISIDNEIDILNKYIEIESLRFKHSFRYEIIADPRFKGSNIRIPQMLIQPFVENAIWHGLLPKKDNGKLTITFEYINKEILSCTIDDAGVGRSSSASIESIGKNKSLGILFITQRLELMKKIWGGDYNLTITDKTDSEGIASGTQIKIIMPIHYA